MSQNSFSHLGLSPAWLENLNQLGYTEMTPIQAQALPTMLEGRDVIGQASTGTGKTAAFGLALLSRIPLASTPANLLPGALVLCPTRELAAQIADEIRRLARPIPNTNVVTLTGGTSFSRQRESLKHGIDIIVGTPGRVLDHLQRGTLDLSAVQTLVLDEADRMLEMGFIDDVETIITHATLPDRQTLLFSATVGDEIRQLSTLFQHQAAFISVANDTVAPDITQILYDIGPVSTKDDPTIDPIAARIAALRHVLAYHKPASAVIFANERDTVDAITADLTRAGHAVRALHGGMEQPDRDNTLLMFANASIRLLVATNVAARGLDIDELDAVINFELPRDTKEFVHRVGRTGRAGEQGLAITLIASHETRKLKNFADFLDGLDPTPLARVPHPTESPEHAATKTVVIQGGRKDKLRPGDIVGALTKDLGIDNANIGKITITDRFTYVALASPIAGAAVVKIRNGKIKGRTFRTYSLK